MVRRAFLRVVPVLLLLVAASPAQAIEILDGVVVDTSVRLEYLFGAQVIRDADPEMVIGGTRFRFDFDQRTPFVSGMAEVTPNPWFSCRAMGGLSFLEPSRRVRRSANFNLTGVPHDMGVSIKPQARMWEAAGLYHLYNAGGYRFSITGGYRQQNWLYHGEDDGDYLKEIFISRIPFIGMQTAMFFPWCKARFEVLGSPLVRKSVTSCARRLAGSSEFSGVVGQGGFIEIQIEGTVRLSPNVQAGLVGRYLFEDLRGMLNGNVNGTKFDHFDAYSNETMAVVGLEATLLF